MPRWIWIAIALALASGCERKQADPGPPCEQIADHVGEVARKIYPGHGDMMPGGNRQAYVDSCKARKYTAEVRRCMLKAQSMEALAACMPRESPDEKKPGAGPAPSPPPPPAPAPQ
jgi:hypothetical protein